MEYKLSIRIPDDLHSRLEYLAESPPTSMRYRVPVKLSAVVREALARGVESLELERDARRQEKPQ